MFTARRHTRRLLKPLALAGMVAFLLVGLGVHASRPAVAQIPVETGSLEVVVTYNGQPPSATGTPCFFGITLVGVGTFLPFCDSYTKANIIPGEYTLNLDLPFAGIGAVVPPATITIVGGATTTVEFDVSGAMGLLTGQITVNGQPPPPGFGLSASTGGATALTPGCCPPPPAGWGDGSFSLLLPDGPGTGRVYADNFSVLVATFAYNVIAGQTTDISIINVETGNLEVVVTYNGQPPSATGTPCFFGITLVGVGTFLPFCDSYTKANIIPGEYTLNLDLPFAGIGAVVPPATITIVGGATTTVEFDVSGAMGLLTGQITVNGQPPPPGFGLFASTGGATALTPGCCPPPPAGWGDGSFSLLLPDGPGTGRVYADNFSVLVATFAYNVIAGQTTNVGNPLDPDTDGDGVPNTVDACPNDPEDFDGFQDTDGCPDPDNDGDGILDVNDACPNEPEDFDSFQDGDGCPEPCPGGDVNGDGRVDFRDVVLVGRALGSRPGGRRWNPAADLNHNGRVDLGDLSIVVRSSLDPACRPAA